MAARYAHAHEAPQGPGDARPTALDIINDEDLLNKLAGKTFLVTGATSGIGVETARAIHATGADVFITARDTTKAKEVVSKVLETSPGKGKLQILHLELDSLDSVRKFAAAFQEASQQLHGLITNAGVMACPETKTKDGFEQQFGVNHLGHFLLFELLKPQLLASSTPEFQSRVVALTSRGHQMDTVHLDDLDFGKRGYDQWQAYGQSKTANIWFANEIERRYGSQGLHATSVHPGAIWTDLGRHLPPESLKMFDTPHFRAIIKSVEQGAATTVWAAVGKEWEGRGGKYLEDVSIAEPFTTPEPGSLNLGPGYVPHAYDEQGATQLWDISRKLVGLA